MITLHFLEYSRAHRIIWLLEELKASTPLEYEIKYYQRDPETLFAPVELENIHPLGKAPVIHDSNTGITLAESGAIIEYLIDNYATSDNALKPNKATSNYWDYIYWLHFCEGSLLPPLLFRLVFEKVKTSPMPFFAKPIAKQIANNVMSVFVKPNIRRLLAFIENHLEQNTWFAGDHISGADIQMSYPLDSLYNQKMLSKYPHITAYVERLHKLPTYATALKLGGSVNLPD